MNNAANQGPLGTAVVTGASSGLGKVYADRLAARGHDLLLVARREDRLKEVAADLTARYPVKVSLLVADLADPAGLARVMTALAADETITLLVNNAGTSAVGSVTEISMDTITSMIALNITALTGLTRAVLPAFQARDAGTIINIGSVVGYGGYPWVPVYGATKGYVLNFTQALQQQLVDTGVRVQLVTPAATVSEIWDAVGVPLSDLEAGTVMTTEHCVDAALHGLDSGELITAPPLHDDAVLRRFEEASQALLQASMQTGEPAPRYGLRATA
jgi:short-subunit dehydrogenase